MDNEQKILSQKEYLKKYLPTAKDKKEKKKKKVKVSSSTFLKRSVIIDDDVPLAEVPIVKEEEIINFNILGDEAPQIAGYVDERPLHMIWKAIGEDDDNDEEADGFEERKRKENLLTDKFYSVAREDKEKKAKNGKKADIIVSYDKRPQTDVQIRKFEESQKHKRDETERKRKHKSRKGESDLDQSPRRRRRRDSDSDVSVSRKTDRRESRRKRNDSDSDVSVHRKGKYRSSDKHRSRRKEYDSDASIERHKSRPKYDRSKNREDERSRKHVSKHRNSDSDLSPPRHGGKQRKRQPESPRKTRASDSDMSPPRKSNKTNNSRKNQESTNSPNRKNSSTLKRHADKGDSDPSPPRKSKGGNNKEHSRHQMDKTLDGKKSGLQSAKNLKDELKELKEKEDRAFRQMDPAALGKSATTVLRDRKTGLKRDIEKEQEESQEKMTRDALRKEKYDRWGKGLKQLRDTEDKIADTMHEMAKPLARYKDDEDLDKFLRGREREGDPMLDYIKKHQIESHHVIDLSAPESGRKKYKGLFNPNRFGIAPGYRWDGVDRSNGYEQKWFEQKSARKAGEEEVYKWSVSDM